MISLSHFTYQKSTTKIYKKIALAVILLFVFMLALPQITLAADPHIKTIFPKSIKHNSPDIIITINGSDFPSDAKVIVGSTFMETTCRSSTRCEIAIPETFLKNKGGAGGLLVRIQTPLVSNHVFLNIEPEPILGLFDYTHAIYDELRAFFSNFPTSFFTQGVKVISQMILWITKTFAEYAGLIFKYIIGTMVKEDAWSITRDKICDNSSPPLCVNTFAGSAFLIAWTEVKKWANMLIVLALLGVAIATILRFKEYEAKKLLPGILIVALLINFSVVFVGLIIDGSNIVMKELLVGSNGTEGSDLVLRIDKALNNIVLPTKVDSTYKSLLYSGRNFIFATMYSMIAIALLWFSFIFIERYVILAILFILSPLAFVFYVFPIPKARQLFQDWWQHFIKWCFIGLGGAFFLNLATSILLVFSELDGGNGLSPGGENGFVITIVRVLVVLFFMFAGLKMIAKADGFAKIAMAAVAAIVAAIVTGGTSIMGSVSGGALKMAGNTKAGEKVKENSAGLRDRISQGYGKAREAIGLDKQGTANKNYQDKLASRMKPYESLADAEKNDDVVKERAVNASSGAERAAYAKELAKRKKTHLIEDATEAQRTMANAEAFGVDTGEFVKGNPELAKFDTKKVAKERADLSSADIASYMASSPTILTLEQAEQGAAERKVKISAIKKMGAPNIAGMKNVDIDVIEHSGSKKIAEALKEMSEDQIDQIRNFQNTATSEMVNLNAREAALMAAGAAAGSLSPSQIIEANGIAAEKTRTQRLIDKINLLNI